MTRGLVALVLVMAACGPAAAAPLDDLMALASTHGSVRLVVKLYAPAVVPEAALARSRASVLLQRVDISDLQDALLASLAGTSHQVLWRYETSPYVALEVTPAALDALVASPLVEEIVQDFEMSPQLATTGPLVQVDAARALGLTGEGQAIVIVDSGVDRSHPFFSGRVVDEWCTVSSAGGCPNGANGAGAAAPVRAHGTHVAGIAAGSGASFSGMAPGAAIIAIKVFPASGGASFADIKAALDRVIVLKDSRAIAAVNMSIGTVDFTSASACDATDAPYGLKPDIDTLRAAGIATVVSTGNASLVSEITYPACLSNTIKASASTRTDSVADYANLAPTLEATTLLAPGGDDARLVCSSRPAGMTTDGGSCTNAGTSGAFGFAAGTSMAAPHIAGAWALLKQAKPTATVDEILSALRGNAVAIVDTPTSTTYRRIRIRDSVASVTGLSVTVAASPASPQAVATSITVTATATGGVPTLRYKWRVNNGGAWTVAKDWSTSNTFSWKPATAGSYSLSVWVKSGTVSGDGPDGAAATASVSFSITAGTQLVYSAGTYYLGGVAISGGLAQAILADPAVAAAYGVTSTSGISSAPTAASPAPSSGGSQLVKSGGSYFLNGASISEGLANAILTDPSVAAAYGVTSTGGASAPASAPAPAPTGASGGSQLTYSAGSYFLNGASISDGLAKAILSDPSIAAAYGVTSTGTAPAAPTPAPAPAPATGGLVNVGGTWFLNGASISDSLANALLNDPSLAAAYGVTL